MTDFFEPAGRGVQHASLRAANRRAVLTTITFSPGISNADVSRRTGLAPQTASAIVSELESEGLIRRGDVLRGRRGQPATPLFLNYDASYSVGCEVGWQHIEVILIDLGSRVIGRYRREYEYPDATTIVAEAVSAILELVGKLSDEQRTRLVGVGVASPTGISRNLALVSAPQTQTQAWQALDMRGGIEKGTGLSTLWFNDGNAGCWAELVMHPAPRPSNFAYLFVGSFLGAGIIAEHTLWEGPTGNSANLGSMLVTRADGTRQFGHLIASVNALETRLKAAGIAVPRVNPLEWPWEEWEPQVAAWLADAGEALAEIVLNTAAVIEVDRAVIDGTLPPPIVERLVEATRSAIEALPVLTFDRPRLFAGHIGGAAVPFGAAQLSVFHKYFSRELSDMLG